MDLNDWVLGGMLVFSILVSVVGFWRMFRRQERDEAIDAAVFLAQRQLEEYLRSRK